MGESCFCVDFDYLETAEVISIIEIVVNIILAIWIISNIQNRSTNRRVLKDHFINEVKEIRADYKICLSNLYNGKSTPQNIIPWFKLMNIKVADMMTDINELYKIEQEFLKPYQLELRELITNNADFISQYNSTSKLLLGVDSKNEIMRFQQSHSKLFSKLILKINNY